MNIKQKEVKIALRIKLNYNIYGEIISKNKVRSDKVVNKKS